ncbi:MAG: sugar ABC transporter permease [Propionibacteriaceae bacterium]|nr:sugar ABC transporter permease [Propionibacteriaceae bacterium]
MSSSVQSERPGASPVQALPVKASPTRRREGSVQAARPSSFTKRAYPLWFHIPAAVIFIALFIVPTIMSFYFAFTRWTLFEATFIGLENFVMFLAEPGLIGSLGHTLIYGFSTSALKVIIGMALAVALTKPIIARGYLRSVTFFPVLVSAVGVGLTFKVLLDQYHGVVNQVWTAIFGSDGPGWLTNPDIALYTLIGIDVWKGVGLATLIYIAGITAIPNEYFEAARVDGAGSWRIFRTIILPLSFPATSTVIILSLIGGLRSFDLIWATTGGGPGFATDVIASVIYKQYQAGFYGLSTAGNVILFIVVTAIVYPLNRWLVSKETTL